MQDYLLLSKNSVIAKIIGGNIEPVIPKRLPLFLQNMNDINTWLESRAVDSHRTNSRLLKRALRLERKDDINTVLSVGAATITDNYWVKPIEDETTKYEDIRFTVNRFDSLALTGDVNSFDQPPSRTPELTNTGSFEKCWRLYDGDWWMIKAGKNENLFSELLIYKLGKLLNFPMAEYEPEDKFIKSRDFTNNAKADYEPAAGIIKDESNYIKIYEMLKPFGEAVINTYMQMCYLDALIYNLDRHEYNFGLLRDSDTGEVISLAPFFDHNIALVSNGYPMNTTAENDILIKDFAELLKHTGQPFKVKELTQNEIEDCISQIPWELPATETVSDPLKFVSDYLLNRQSQIKKQAITLNAELYFESSDAQEETQNSDMEMDM